MAYRNLFFVALVTGGLLAAGCGSGEGRFIPAGEDNGGLPIASGDQAAESEDQPPGNDEQAPVNDDQPPGNPDQPPSGGTVGGPVNGGGPCDGICDTIDEQCDGGQGQNPLRRLCAAACTVPDGATAVPCLSQLASLLDCGVSAGGLCPTEDQTESLQQQCQSQYQAFSVCRQAAEPPDDNPGVCTADGGCENCGSECLTCVCEADGDTTAAAACAPACMP